MRDVFSRFALVALTAIAPTSAFAQTPAAASRPVDLLHAVATDVAVSSAYRNQRVQADSLVDGNLETAWNSRTGELASSFIEVRIPASARVSSIAMTAGFTQTTPTADLFSGNHRVSRVRVLRDGVLLSEHALNIESRDLQTLPVSGPGGVYRIEIAAVQAGSHATWREVCVSELRVMGTDAGAREGLRIPRTAVGAFARTARDRAS